MVSNVILPAPKFTPSIPNLVNKTATTITVSWTPVASYADGYVVNVTSNTHTHTVTQQVKGGNQNEMTLKGCHGDPCNTCTCTTRYYNQFIEVSIECSKYNNNI